MVFLPEKAGVLSGGFPVFDGELQVKQFLQDMSGCCNELMGVSHWSWVCLEAQDEHPSPQGRVWDRCCPD